MPKIEIDESEFQQMERVRQTLARINQNAEGKRLLQKAQKLIDPNAVTPDLDEDEKTAKIREEYQKKLDAIETQIQADKEKREQDAALSAANARWEAGRQELRSRGYTPEGIEAVEKQMQDRGIADHVIMADHLERQNPPQEVLSPRAFGAFNFAEPPMEDDTFLKRLFDSKGNDDNAVLQAAAEAIGEVRQARRR